jgi:ubiquinone biosynthesis protein
VTELADEFADRLREELDFRREARNATEIAAAMTAADRVHVSAVHGELSTARVLVMEWLDGVSVRKVERIDALGLDRSRLAKALLRCALRQMLVDGRFHADPHPGNVLVLADGRLGLIDFGATGRLDPLQQASMREMLVAVQQRDAGLLRSAVLEVATLRRHFDDDQLERALASWPGTSRPAPPPARPCSTTCCSCSSPSGSTSRRSSRPSPGPGHPGGDPHHPVPGLPGHRGRRADRGRVARASLAPASLEDLARRELGSLALLLRRTPRQLDRIATIVQRGDLQARVRLLADEEDVRTLTRLLNRVVLAGLGGLVGLVGHAPRHPGRPEVHRRHLAVPVLRLLWLFCATVLILRVIVAILRDGLN